MSSETFPRSLDPTDQNLPRLPGEEPPHELSTRRHTHCLTLTGKGYWASGVIIGVLVATLRVGAHTLVAQFCKRVRDCQLETTNPKVIVKPCKIVNARRASTIAMYHVSQNRFTTRGRRNIQASLFHFDLYIAYGMYSVRGRKKVVDEEPQKAARIFSATTLL
jgi:hypothetical protein